MWKKDKFFHEERKNLSFFRHAFERRCQWQVLYVAKYVSEFNSSSRMLPGVHPGLRSVPDIIQQR